MRCPRESASGSRAGPSNCWSAQTRQLRSANSSPSVALATAIATPGIQGCADDFRQKRDRWGGISGRRSRADKPDTIQVGGGTSRTFDSIVKR